MKPSAPRIFHIHLARRREKKLGGYAENRVARCARLCPTVATMAAGLALTTWGAVVLPQDLRYETVDGIQWSYVMDDGRAKVTNWNGNPAIDSSTTGAIVVPDSLGGCPVTAIGAYAFYQMTGITSLTIPEGVEEIEYYACRGCTGLKSVTLPSTLTTIGNGVFTGCQCLEAGILPDSVTSMGRDLFWGCTSMTSVTFSANVASLDTMTCFNCDNLTNVVIPHGVTDIGVSAFLRCDNLRSVSIPATVTNIGNYAFNECVSLEALELPAGLTALNDCFSGCTSLTTVTIPASVGAIDAVTFKGCSSMTNIVVDLANAEYKSVDGILYDITGTELVAWPYGRTPIAIPAGVRRIGDSVFMGRRDIVSVVLPEGLETIGASAFDQCVNLATADFPSTLKAVGSRAFYNCSALSSATFSEGFETVAEKAFWNTGIQSLVFPESTTLIDQYAFSGCRQLQSLEVESQICSIAAYAFDNCPNLASVRIAEGADISAYAFGHPSLDEDPASGLDEDDPLANINVQINGGPLTEGEKQTLAGIVGLNALRDVSNLVLLPSKGEPDDAALTCVQLGISPVSMKTVNSKMSLYFTNPTVAITGFDPANRVVTGRIIPAEGTKVVQPPMRYMFGLTKLINFGTSDQDAIEYGNSFSRNKEGFAVDLSDYVTSNGVFSLAFPSTLVDGDSAFFSVTIKPYAGRSNAD